MEQTPARVAVVINGRFLLESRPTGTQRSALGFARALLQDDSIQLRVCADLDRVGPDERRLLEGAEWSHVPLRNKVRAHLWEQLVFPREWPGEVQIYPLNTGPFLLPGPRQILFIHDIHHLTAPGLYTRLYTVWNRCASSLAAQRAQHIVCFTEHVKGELMNNLQIHPDRIRVVPQGPGIDVDAPLLETRQIPERFILCVGGLQPHKNLKSALAAFARSGLPEDGYKLIIIGRRQQNFSDLEIAPELINAEWLDFTGYVSDGELIAYYRRACALVYVSLMEGFGLPLVEAFHLGCPVITSNVSCLPEVAGTAALLVDPLDLEAIAGAMRSLAGDPALRQQLIERGRARAPLFSWPRAGAALAEEIRQVAQVS